MKLIKVAVRCVSETFHQTKYNQSMIIRTFSTNLNPVNHDNDESQNANSVESVEDFESRIFRSLSNENSSSFYRKLDNIEKAQYGQGTNSNVSGQRQFGFGDGLSTVMDGFNSKLKEAGKYFEFDPNEVTQDDYTFRPDMNFRTGMTYTTEDLNLKKPGVWKPSKRSEFQVTSEEVLRKADFRNVRFLANFLTDAGIIIKRSKTGISAKAQRKVAREIKIARAFGLLPFTTMGTKQFVFGRTMEDLDEDYQLDVYGAPADDIQDPLAE